MGLINALNRILVPRGDINALKHPERAGYYNIYYLTVNHRKSHTGFWIRYTLERRLPGASPSEASLWFHAFFGNAPEKSLGFKQAFDPAGVTSGGDVRVRIAGAELRDDGISGAAAGAGHQASWDLKFEPSALAIVVAPPAPLRGLWKGNVVTVHRDARFRGTITLDGERFEIEGDPGIQAHMWGGRRPQWWTWMHASGFDGDAPCVVDGGSGGIKKLGRDVGPFTLVSIHYRGEEFLCNALPYFVTARSQSDFPNLRFQVGARGTRFEGTFTAPPEAFVQVEYEDPNGQKAWCCNTDLGDLVLDVKRGGKLVETLRCTGHANYEFTAREKRPGVRMTVGA